MKTNYVCPSCHKVVSEFALKCPHCAVSFEDNKPQLEEPISLSEKAKDIKILPRYIQGIVISIIVLLIFGFVFLQANKALSIVHGASTMQGLLLFNDAVLSGSLASITPFMLISGIISSIALIIIVIFIIKIAKLNKKDK